MGIFNIHWGEGPKRSFEGVIICIQSPKRCMWCFGVLIWNISDILPSSNTYFDDREIFDVFVGYIIHILVKVNRTVGLDLEMVENALVDVQSWFSIEVWHFAIFSHIGCSRRYARLQNLNLNLQNCKKIELTTLAKLNCDFFSKV